MEHFSFPFLLSSPKLKGNGSQIIQEETAKNNDPKLAISNKQGVNILKL
jgi:hypothetical protein